MAGGPLTNTAVPLSTSLTLQSLNGLFAIYKKEGPTSADVLNKLKEVLLKGNRIQSAVRKGALCVVFPSNLQWSFLCVFRGWCQKPKSKEEEETEPKNGTWRDAGQRCQWGSG